MDFDIFVDGVKDRSYLNFDFYNYVNSSNDNYELFLITEKYKYRIDLISEKFYERKDFGVFILYANNIKSVEDLKTGRHIKIPKNDVIYSYYFNKRKNME